MAALGMDQTQRNLDRTFDRSLFNDTSDLVNRGLLFEEGAARSDISRSNLESNIRSREFNANTNALNARINAERGVGGREGGLTPSNLSTSLGSMRSAVMDKQKTLGGINEKLSEMTGKLDKDQADYKRVLRADREQLTADIMGLRENMRMIQESIYGEGRAFTPSSIAERPRPNPDFLKSAKVE